MSKRVRAKSRTIDELEAESALIQLSMDLDAMTWRQDARLRVPEGWGLVDGENPVRTPKVKMTLRLDADVADWFRQQGDGYQARVNAVLRMYMMAKAAKLA
jgi:uncharacterized protein (DUF4415 family)